MSVLEKNKTAEEFFNEYRELNENKKALFTRCCNKLMDENFVYGQHSSDINDYYSILEMKDLIQNYFAVVDIEIRHDDERKIIYLESKESKTRVKFKKMESVLLIVLRLLYYRKSKELDSSTNIMVSLDDIVIEIQKTGIYPKIVKSNLVESLKTIRKYKLVSFESANIETNPFITIYPTICIVVNASDVQTMMTRLMSYVNASEEDEDETNED